MLKSLKNKNTNVLFIFCFFLIERSFIFNSLKVVLNNFSIYSLYLFKNTFMFNVAIYIYMTLLVISCSALFFFSVIVLIILSLTLLTSLKTQFTIYFYHFNKSRISKKSFTKFCLSFVILF